MQDIEDSHPWLLVGLKHPEEILQGVSRGVQIPCTTHTQQDDADILRRLGGLCKISGDREGIVGKITGRLDAAVIT